MNLPKRKEYRKLKFKVGDRLGTKEVVNIIYDDRVKYEILCDCGTVYKWEAAYFALNRKCKHCGPLKLLSTKVGDIEYLEYLGKGKFKMRCVCGNIFTDKSRVKSCGCHIINNNISNAKKLIGTKSYGITIIDFIGFRKGPGTSSGAFYKAKCKCGKLFEIRRGMVFRKKTCGCRIINNMARGERQGNSRLTDVEVNSIKDFFHSGTYTKKQLCEIFNMPDSHLQNILVGKSWAHIKINDKLLKKLVMPRRCNTTKINPGDRFGCWEVIEKSESKHNQAYYLCRCTCGKEGKVNGSSLRKGKSTKCYNCNAENFADLRRKVKRLQSPIAPG